METQQAPDAPRCAGHRMEQNKFANMARKDAANIMADIKNLQKDFNAIARVFSAPPRSLVDWSRELSHLKLKPNVSIAGRSKLTFIPVPSKRKTFLKNLVTYYGNIIALDKLYNEYVTYISTSITPYKALFEAIDKTKGKSLKQKIWNYIVQMSSERAKKLQAITDKKKGAGKNKFLLLFNGTLQKAFIVPFRANSMVCPTNPALCECKARSEVKGEKDCERECKPKCKNKVYRFQNVEYTFRPFMNSLMKFNKATVALRFEQIAPESLRFIAQHEISLPVGFFMTTAQHKFRVIRKLIKETKALPSQLLKTLGQAANRKKRGWFF